jgi:hypothetical protein
MPRRVQLASLPRQSTSTFDAVHSSRRACRADSEASRYCPVFIKQIQGSLVVPLSGTPQDESSQHFPHPLKAMRSITCHRRSDASKVRGCSLLPKRCHQPSIAGLGVNSPERRRDILARSSLLLNSLCAPVEGAECPIFPARFVTGGTIRNAREASTLIMARNVVRRPFKSETLELALFPFVAPIFLCNPRPVSYRAFIRSSKG